MKSFPGYGWLAVLFVAMASGSVRAETIELVTYYPSQANTGDLHVRSLTVGDAIRNDTPLNGVALIFDELGIGLPPGTTDPAGPLHVVGPPNTAASVVFMPGAGVGTMRFGIGTTTPQNALHIRSATPSIQIQPPADSTARDILFANAAGTLTDSVWQLSSRPTPDAFNAGAFIIANYLGGAFTPRVTVTTAGNVGIGVAAPAVRLDVAQNAAIRVGDAYISSGFNPIPPANFAHFGQNGWYDGNTWRIPNPAQRSGLLQIWDDALYFWQTLTPGQADWNARLSLVRGGNVGIGIGAPRGRLDVAMGNLDGIVMYQPGDNSMAIQTVLDGQPISVYGGPWENRLCLQPVIGTVGIGTTVPAARLHVAGMGPQTAAVITAGTDGLTYRGDWPAGWGGGLATWDITCSSIYYTGLLQRSDQRFKKEITGIGNIPVMERLNHLRPVSFRWKDVRLGGKRHYGFTAQDVEKIFPELVATSSDAEATKSLRQDEFIPLLVQALQELHSEADRLREKTERLERELAVLKRRAARKP